MKEAITASVRMTIDDSEGILRVTVKENAKVDIDEVKRYLEIADQITNSQEILVLLDASSSFTMTSEARAYTVRHSYKRIAVAIVTRKLLYTISSKIFYYFNRPAYPVKIFSSEEKALKWLKSREHVMAM